MSDFLTIDGRDPSRGYLLDDNDAETLRRWGYQPSKDEVAREEGYDNVHEFHKWERKVFIERHNAGIDLFHEYVDRFRAAEPGGRPAIQALREELRGDMRILEHYGTIARIVKGKMDWMHSIFRAEAALAEREGSDRAAKIREKQAEERKAEEAEMAVNPIFGMF